MPVYSNLDLDYKDLRLGARIRLLRKAKGWTLQDLAGKLSLSIASLSTIETDKAMLDLDRLFAICDALGVGPDALFPQSRSSHFHVAHRAVRERESPAELKVVDQKNRTLTPYHNLLRPLADPFVGKHFEPFQIEILRVEDHEVRYISHHQEEFFFVLEGEVECLLRTPAGMARPVLGRGDCIYFWSFLPHCLRSTSRRPAISVHALYSAHGSTDSERENSATADVVYFQDASGRSLGQQVAQKITVIRQSRGKSLADFARELGIGVRQLADIERGKKPVSITFLLRLCRQFRKPFEYFLADTALVEPPFFSVVRASDIGRLPLRARRSNDPRDRYQSEYRPLADGFRGHGIHPYHVRAIGNQTGSIALHEHHGQEFVFVLSGEILLVTIQAGERVTQQLVAGDCCFLDSAVPHRFVGAGLSPYERTAEIIDVFWSGLGEPYLFGEASDLESDAASTAS